MESLLFWTVALKWPSFEWKKVFANLSLGLFYYSKVSSKPQSGDAVPLNMWNNSSAELHHFDEFPFPSTKIYVTIFFLQEIHRHAMWAVNAPKENNWRQG
jgi:hypothetical protein